MPNLGKTTFNCDQNRPVKSQKADIVDRMVGNPGKGIPPADRVAVQECVDVDLHALAASVPGWGAIQTRVGDNDGRANTGVLYRISAGVPSKEVCVPIGDAPDTRRRFLAGGLFPEGWDWSAHIFPARDREFIPAQIAAIGEFVKNHPGNHTGGFDRNQALIANLERATGLTWHAPKKAKDPTGGILTNLPVTSAVELPFGFSDHPGDQFVVTAPVVAPKPQPEENPVPTTPTPKPSWLDRALTALRKAFAFNTKHGNKEKAARAKAAIKALRKPKPQPKPAPTPPPVQTAPRGWMPGAVREPVPFGSSDPTIIPVSVAQHIAVSDATSLQDQFENDGGIESHFYILKDGTIKQHRSIFVQADAQFDGNGFGSPLKGVVSVEHQGGRGDDLNKPMPKAQLDAFHRVILFVRDESPVGDQMMRVCPAWNAPGVGYHAMFEEWNHSHHSCPGAARIKQFHDVTVPWLARGGK